MIAYRKDQELPALALEWRDSGGSLIDFSSGWTFTVVLATAAARTRRSSPRRRASPERPPAPTW